jgi:hypothetical protein
MPMNLAAIVCVKNKYHLTKTQHIEIKHIVLLPKLIFVNSHYAIIKISHNRSIMGHK